MSRRLVLFVCVMIVSTGLFAAETPPAPAKGTASDKRPAPSFFVRVFAEEGGSRLWDLGTTTIPGERASIVVGKVLCTRIADPKSGKGAPSAVQEVRVGLQLSVALRLVDGNDYHVELSWNDDKEIGRTEQWIDRKASCQNARVAGTLGVPKLVGLIKAPGGAELTVHVQVDAR